MRLFRALSRAEWTDFQINAQFRPGPPSFQGKWFAESSTDAVVWGQRLHRNSMDGFLVVEIEVPDAIAQQFFRLPSLDGIGPARFVTMDELDLLNGLPVQVNYSSP